MAYSEREKELVMQAFALVEEMMALEDVQGAEVIATEEYVEKVNRVKELLREFDSIIDLKYEHEK